MVLAAAIAYGVGCSTRTVAGVYRGPGMTRVLLFLFAVMQAQIVVSVALVPSTICPERCQDDGPDGRCPPACPSCLSAAHPAPPLPARLVTAPSVHREALPVVANALPPQPEPTDIFHVPKRLLA